MSYTTHGFVSGMGLTSTAIAEMDTQIAANETAITSLSSQLQTLNLVVDDDTAYLYLGNTLLSSASLSNVSSSIVCTDLVATGVLTGLTVGNTAQITVIRQPSDCNETILYKSSDITVATVSSTGLVTGTGSGTATITITCGEYSQVLTTKVSRIVSLINSLSYCSWMLMDAYWGVSGVVFNTAQQEYNDYLGTMPFDFDKYKIKNGEKVTITTLENNWGIRLGFIVKAISGQTLTTTDDRTNNNRYLVGNVEQVVQIQNSPSTYTYTNDTGTDCWAVFAIKHTGSTTEQALVNIDSKINLTIGPP